jgi:hypothetical protein
LTVDRRKIGRNNKDRAKTYENDAAALLGGKRHLANTGGPEDVLHPWLAVQVKSGLSLVNQIILGGLASAQIAAEGVEKLPCVMLYDRRGRVGRYILFEAEEFARWFKLGEYAC